MKASIALLCLLLAALVLILPVLVSAAPVKVNTTTVQPALTRSGEVENPIVRQQVTHTPTATQTTITATPTATHTTLTSTPTATQTTITATPTATQTTLTSTPTATQTTVTASPTATQTTLPGTSTPTVTATQATTVPVVTVTVFVYPSQDVYVPYYYYPPNYPSPTGSLTVTSNPSGATIILDGYNYGTTPYIFTGLMAGYHTVEVDYPDYEAYIANVYVDYGQNQEVYADLTALVSYGSLVIDSTPQGADVYVDGNYQGTTPVTVGALSDGAHQVELHLVGYDVLTSTQYVSAGQGTVASFTLSPYTSSSVYGSIDVSSNQAGALVYLDGVYKGSTQAGNTFDIISVSPGTHTLLLHLPGYSDITQTEVVYAGQISDVNAVFSPTATQPGTATGSIVVTSVPSGAQVFVDNQFRGITPVTIYNAATGPHTINLHLTGYDDSSTSVNVAANQVVQVPATLVAASGTTPAPTRAGLSPAATCCALAAGAIMVAFTIRK